MKNIQSKLVYVPIVLAGSAYIVAGTSKLLGIPGLHASFALMGLPVWFGYFIGACEVTGGLGLFNRKFSALAAACLLGIMAGAIYFHLYYEVAAHALPAVILSMLLLFIIKVRRVDSIWFVLTRTEN